MEITHQSQNTYETIVDGVFENIHRIIYIVPRVLFPADSEPEIVEEPSKKFQHNHTKKCPKKDCFTKKTSKKPKEEEEEVKEKECCAMCLEDMEKSCECTKLPCGHIFHSKCLSNLRDSNINNTCPLCRAILPPGTLEEELYEHERKTKMINKKLYSPKHFKVLHAQFIFKIEQEEVNIWVTVPWGYNKMIEPKKKYKNKIQSYKLKKKKQKNYKNRR